MIEAVDSAYDLIVLGAGAAGMTAAAVGAAEGMRVLLVEKSGLVGGTTAWSGGMVWVPGNRKAAAVGCPDSLDAARRYLEATVPKGMNAVERETFLTRADEAIAYLEAHTPVRLVPVKRYPDYYPDLPGAAEGGRVLEPQPFEGRLLGERFAWLRPPLPEFTLFGGMMISRPDIAHFRRVGRSLRSTSRVGRLLGAYAWQRLNAPRGTTLYLGNALAARLLLAVTRPEVDLCRGMTVTALDSDEERVRGVMVSRDGAQRSVRATRGVVLATGGISHDPELRRRFYPGVAGDLSATLPTNTGDGVRLGLKAGGRIGQSEANSAFWVPVSRFRRSDGSTGVYPHTVSDRAKPGLLAVNRIGRRFVNEAVSYHEFVQAMFRNEHVGSGPAWLICDRLFLWRYGLGRVKPFQFSVREEIAQAYLRTAATLAGLAQALEVDSGALTATIETFNAGAREGRDPEFGRGSNVYQRYLGDPAHRPNPCVAPITRPPFYAVAVYPADLGSAAGLVTDEAARVLAMDGSAIRGLYACGNDMHSVMNGAYPGPGITLGPALTFGYLAARHAAIAEET